MSEVPCKMGFIFLRLETMVLPEGRPGFRLPGNSPVTREADSARASAQAAAACSYQGEGTTG